MYMNINKNNNMLSNFFIFFIDQHMNLSIKKYYLLKYLY